MRTGRRQGDRAVEYGGPSCAAADQSAHVVLLPLGAADGEQRGAECVRGVDRAIAPSNTADRHALLLINPHTSFFFRSELQMVSNEGLNAYGASTWRSRRRIRRTVMRCC